MWKYRRGTWTASSYAQPEMWEMLDGLEERCRPAFVRGDCAWGTERAMAGAEQRAIPYLFKLKQSPNAKKLVGKLLKQEGWVDAGQGWEGLESELRLTGWSKMRRVVVLRRPLRQSAAEGEKTSKRKRTKQMTLDLGAAMHLGVSYESAVLVTSMGGDVRAIGQHYRDRGGLGERFRRVEKPVGMGRIHDAGPEAMPGDGAHNGTHLQLLADLHALGNSGQTCRGSDIAAAGAARHRAADPARQSDDGGDHQHLCEGIADYCGIDAGQRLSETNKGKCGAVDATRTMAPDPQRSFSSFSLR